MTSPNTTDLGNSRRRSGKRCGNVTPLPLGSRGGCCDSGCGPISDVSISPGFGADLYDPQNAAGAPDAAVAMSLGCGVPTEVADLHAGETVLDLGSGGGADVLISARRVGPGGKAIGLDMTDEMLDLARRHAADAGVTNVEFIKGYIEDIPLPDAAVDVVISNCVINLAADKRAVLRESARVLRSGADSPSPTSSPTQTWTTKPDSTCSNGPVVSPALSRARVRRGPRRCGVCRHRHQRDAPRPHPRRFRDHPSSHAVGTAPETPSFPPWRSLQRLDAAMYLNNY